MRQQAIRTLSLNNCDPCDDRWIKEVCQKLGTPLDIVGNTYRFISHVMSNEQKAIISTPCGSGKSTFAYAHCLKRYHQMEEMDAKAKDVWMVVDRLEAGQERAATLRKLGIDEKCIGFYHSFWNAECHGYRNDNLSYQEITKDVNICRDCGFKTQCLSSSSTRRLELKKPFVIMTQEGFVRLHERQAVPGNVEIIPGNVEIIIDEEIVNLYCSTFRKDELEALLAHVPWNTPALEAVRSVIVTLNNIMETPSKRDCSRRWNIDLDNKTKVQAINDLQTFVTQQRGNGLLYDATLDIAEKWYVGKLLQIGYAISLQQPYRTFVYADSGNKDITIARDRIHFDIPNNVVLLNGSAECSRFPYEQMPICKCTELVKEYSNLICAPINAVPTKSWLKKEDNLTQLLELAKAQLGDNVFIARNKTASDKQIACITKYFPNGKQDTRAAFAGSNLYRTLDNALIAMSLFTKLSVYTLMASIRNDKEYTRDDIFTVRKGKLIPKLYRDHHLANDDIDNEFQLHAAYEIHQAVLRTSCREQLARPVTVVLLIPHFEMVVHLQRLMPGFKLKGGDDKVFRLVDMVLTETEPIANSYIYDLIGWNPKDADHRRTVDSTCKAFGWEKRHDPTQAGNCKLWVRAGEDLLTDCNTSSTTCTTTTMPEFSRK